MFLRTERGAFLLSGQGTGAPSAFGTPQDFRATRNFGYLEYNCGSPSAILHLQASKDSTGWMTIMTVTAVPATATAQISAFYPYMRALAATAWSTTATAWMHYTPGLP